VKYEDASWHSGADEYPKELPAQAAGTHTGMFVAWALLGGLGSSLHAGHLPRLRQRQVTPGALCMIGAESRTRRNVLRNRAQSNVRADASHRRHAAQLRICASVNGIVLNPREPL
jgi:hypothetical protein